MLKTIQVQSVPNVFIVKFCFKNDLLLNILPVKIGYNRNLFTAV